LELDHVLIAVADLAAAGRELEARHGLASIEGGRHAGYGTANRIVPLGDSYLELVTVADESEAARSPFGSWVARVQSERVRPLGWAVRTHGLDAVARRLERTIRVGSRTTRSGAVLRWRLAGLERAAAEPSLPFSSSGRRERRSRAASRRATRPAPFGSQSCSSPATATASPIGWVPSGCRSPSARGRQRL
jgi:hypothetical protein